MTLFEELTAQSNELETKPGMSPDEYGHKLEVGLSFLSRLEELTLSSLRDKMAKIAEVEKMEVSTSEKDRLVRRSNEGMIFDLLNKRMAVLESRISALQSLMKTLRSQFGGQNG